MRAKLRPGGREQEFLRNRREPGDSIDAKAQHVAGPTNFAAITSYAGNADADPRSPSLLFRPRNLFTSSKISSRFRLACVARATYLSAAWLKKAGSIPVKWIKRCSVR